MSPLSRLPFPGLAPSGVAMQKLRLSPGTNEEAERRSSATCPPSGHHQLQKTPCPIGNQDTPHGPPPAHWWRVNLLILGSDRARTLLPTPSKRGHLALPPAPLPQLASLCIRKTPHPSNTTIHWHPSLQRKEIKTLP